MLIVTAAGAMTAARRAKIVEVCILEFWVVRGFWVRDCDKVEANDGRKNL